MPEAHSLPPMRPMLAESPSEFVVMERAVEEEYRPRMLLCCMSFSGEWKSLRNPRARSPRFALNAGESWFARMCGRFHGWPPSGALRLGYRVTVAGPASPNADR